MNYIPPYSGLMKLNYLKCGEDKRREKEGYWFICRRNKSDMKRTEVNMCMGGSIPIQFI